MKITWFKDFAIVYSSIAGYKLLSHIEALALHMLADGLNKVDVARAIANKYSLDIDQEWITKLEINSKVYIKSCKKTHAVVDKRNLFHSSGKKLFPSNVTLMLTDKCDLKCSYCFFKGKRERDTLPTEKVLDVLRCCAEFGYTNIHLAGGEPFLHPGIMDVIAACSKYDLFTTISTNGIRLTKERIESLERIGLQRIQISLDSLRKSTLQDISKSTKSSRIIDNLKLLSRKKMIATTVRTVVTKSNYKEIMELAAFTGSLGVSKHSFSLPLPFYPYSEIMPSQSRLSTEALAEHQAFSIFKHAMYDPYEPKECSGLTSSLTVGANGDVMLCPFMTDTVYGSINRNSLEEIWDSADFEKLLSFETIGLENKSRIHKKKHGCPAEDRFFRQRIRQQSRPNKSS